jgi:hypothetical protein
MSKLRDGTCDTVLPGQNYITPLAVGIGEYLTMSGIISEENRTNWEINLLSSSWISHKGIPGLCH